MEALPAPAILAGRGRLVTPTLTNASPARVKMEEHV